MACDEKTQEDLVALIQHELTAERESEVQKHLETCAACRDEYEQIRTVAKTAKRINLLEPSAAFRKNLERRIGEAIEHSKRSALQKRPGSTGVRLPNVAQGAQTPEAAGASKRMVQPSAPEAVSKRISARLAERPAKPRPVWLAYIALVGLLVLCGLLGARFYLFPKSRQAGDPAKVQRGAAESRWNKRREAPAWEKILAENRLQLPDEAGAGEAVYLVTHRLPEFHEECLVGYPAEVFDRLRSSWSSDAERIWNAKMVARAAKIPVEAGKLVLPPAMVGEFLGGPGNRVTVIKVDGRIEFWSASAFERYRGASPLVESAQDSNPALPSESGLPYEADAKAESVQAP